MIPTAFGKTLRALDGTRHTGLLLHLAAGMGLLAALGWSPDRGSRSLLSRYSLDTPALNICYSLSLKHIVIPDVFVPAAGFVIRVPVGAVAVGVPASYWLLLCTLLLALFLGFFKRRSEIELLQEDSVCHRSVLASCSPALINRLNVILCSSAVVCHALYTVAPGTVARYGANHLIYTIPFVPCAMFRYLFLVEIRHDGGDPSSLILGDRPFALCSLRWLLACGFVICFQSLME